MKKLILALAICFGLTAYGSNEVKRESTAKVEQVQPQKTGNRVEILYFHGKQRCATCMAIGFCNARKNPDTFKNGVIQKVKSLLK